jgi:hypothetical protein
MLYASQAAENRGTFSKDHLKRFAAAAGLADRAGFDQCASRLPFRLALGGSALTARR